jgi:hypothetical protein
MKNTEVATHKHKRVGAVVVLRSTAELAEVLIAPGGEKFWVKLTDLTVLSDAKVGAAESRKKASKVSRRSSHS